MKLTYKTKGVCSRSIDIEIEDGIIREVQFHGGCDGNTKGVAALVKGARVEDVIERLKGIRCGAKASSCPDQLAMALQEAMANV
ncbi:MAG: TIGR03905 family TSCPD domain-containing protein [Emergencia sp.]